MKGKIIIISGPSGSGKTTLYRKLLKAPELRQKLVKSISVTTRPKRPGETSGRDYFFVSPRMFLYKKNAGHFLESEKVFNNYYGTPKKNVVDLLRKGKFVLMCIDVKGAKVVKKKMPETTTIFIKTPTLADLKARLQARGSENSGSFQLRLMRAKEELAQSRHYDHIVINHNLEDAFRKLKNLVKHIVSSS